MSSTISLPMYAAPGAALQAFWQGLRAHLQAAGLRDVPSDLSHDNDHTAAWLRPDLLLGQTCGYPLMTGLLGRVRLVATPRYRAEGCEGPWSTSLIVVRSDDPALRLEELAGRRAAFNSRDSQSGYNTLRALLAPLATGGRFLGSTVETGSHHRSMELVLAGEADVAAIDCVTFALLARQAPGRVQGLRILCRSARVPSLPLITALSTSDRDVERLRAALRGACRDPDLAAARAELLLDGVEVLPDSAYEVCTTMERQAGALGYPDLA